MDGFYVAKIQKLSDKRHGEAGKKEAEQVKESNESSEAEIESKVNEKKRTEKKKRVKKFRKAEDDNELQIVRKKSKMSIPNVQGQKTTKKKTNAKVTKPRRMKITGM